MKPDDTVAFMSTVSASLAPRTSFKIRLPCLAIGKGDDTSDKIFGLFGDMKDLRELWLSDGVGTWSEEERRLVRYPDYHGAELEALAARFATTCAKLSYLRILDGAWHIVRPETDSGLAELRPLTAWEVENKLPYAFDFRHPRVV